MAAQVILAQGAVDRGGAPPAGAGSIQVPGFVRVIDGDSIEVRVQGRRIGVGIAGIAAPMGNTACGREATETLRRLVAGGVRLDDVPGQFADRRGRRLFRLVTPDGRDAAQEIVKSGHARPTGDGPDAPALRSLDAQAHGRGVGCSGRSGAIDGTEGHSPVGSDGEPPAEAEDILKAASLPQGFVEEGVAAGLNNPTAFAFTPDGRILIAQKNGVVRVVKDGALLPAPFIDLSARVNDYWDRGLLGIAVGASFANDGAVYLFYVYEHDAADYSGVKSSRLVRVTATGDTAAPASEVVVLGTASGGDCATKPAGADCIPADSFTHAGGGLRVAPNGTLFLATGDASTPNFVNDGALRSQSLDSLAGKIVRIDPNGLGLADNPHATGDLAAIRSKVWARGLRNPFKLALSAAGTPYASDVGWNAYEEINGGAGGGNFGWPCFEGPAHQSGYEANPICQALYGQGAGAVRAPLITYPTGTGAALVLGGIYQGTAWPATYQGALFYADYVQGFIRYATLDGAGAVVGQPVDFVTHADFPVDVQFGPDGQMYYLAIYGGDLRRIRNTASGGGPACPLGQFYAEYFPNRTPETRVPSGTPAFTRCEQTIDHAWGAGGPGNGIGTDQFSVRWTGRFAFAAGLHTFTGTADDGIRIWLDGAPVVDHWVDTGVVTTTGTANVTAGEHDVRVEYYEYGGEAVAQANWALTTANRPPVPTITAPTTSASPIVGDTVTFSGQAVDPEDGPVPPERLTWRVNIQHCPHTVCHFHSLIERTGASGSFVVPDHGDESYFEVMLIATDSGGATGQQTVRVDPKAVRVTIESVPTGLQVVYDGTAGTTPFTRATIAGSAHSLNAPATQGGLPFASWSDGGTEANRTVSVGTADQTIVARYTQSATLTVVPTGTGTGSVTGGPITCGQTCTASVAHGSQITLTAAPATGSTFAGWGGACSGAGPCQVTATGEQRVVATFAAIAPGVQVGRAVGPSGPGVAPALTATLTARAGCGPIDRVQIGETGVSFQNARVTVTTPGGGPAGRVAGFSYVPPANTQAVAFTIQRVTESGSATVSPIRLYDGCGEWQTFVGGGPDAFR